jgi:hypothetical protein
VDAWVGGQPFLHAENAIRLPGLLVAGVAAARPSEKLHKAIAALASALLVGFVLVSFRQ